MYPAQIPLSEIQAVVAIVRANQVIEKRATLAYNVWVIQGYAQSQIVGSPSSDSISTQAADDAFFTLEKVADAGDSVTAQVAIDWSIILQWTLQILVDLYMKKS
jgi:hypothetical protein